MDIFPAGAARVALSGAITGDPGTNPAETTQAFDVEMNQATGLGILIADDRVCWSEVLQL